MNRFQRIFLIVIDSFGIGSMPDAAAYDDDGADTLGHIEERYPELHLPTLDRLGLSRLHSLTHSDPSGEHKGYQSVLFESSIGKDTMTGHWEMMGIRTTKPFITFTDTGFPQELIDRLETETGHAIIGNKAASGTEILVELGEESMKTGKMIVYTSADSVMQICGHEETFGLEELYRCCHIARELTMREEWKVGRVIARPYTGTDKDSFVRTPNRHDYALKPPTETALNLLHDHGLSTISVGKIFNIFDGCGVSEDNPSQSSVHGMEQTIEIAKRDFSGLCFVNLVDFDSLWGHRRNPVGYAEELMRFDDKLRELLPLIKDDDLLMITADHGNDPTWHGTDHTRETVPLLVYSPSMKRSARLSDQSSFGTIGATICENFSIPYAKHLIGDSVLADLL